MAMLFPSKHLPTTGLFSQLHRAASLTRACFELLSPKGRCALPLGTPPESHFYFAMGFPKATLDKLNYLAETGDVKGSLGIFRSLQAKSPEKVTRMIWNTMLKACANAGDLTCATSIFNEMSKTDVKASMSTYGKMIETAAKGGKEAEARHWLQLLKSSGYAPDIVIYSSLIDAAAKHGNVKAAEAWLSEMRAACSMPNEVTYSSLINAAEKKGDLAAADSLFSSMQHDDVKPNVVCYVALLSAHVKGGDRQSLVRCFNDMTRSGVHADTPAFTVMIDGFAKAGQMGEANTWLGRMQQAKLEPNALRCIDQRVCSVRRWVEECAGLCMCYVASACLTTSKTTFLLTRRTLRTTHLRGPLLLVMMAI
mmetsp:Transcript_55468/g.179898  ORF Transcript_55468/g.179898 Transcript_55468/m.179898 type:complete len:366 (+) Transcript_55468:61-1158(+)